MELPQCYYFVRKMLGMKTKLPHCHNFVVKMSWKKNRIITMLLLCHENVGNEKQNYYNVITLLWKWWGPIKT